MLKKIPKYITCLLFILFFGCQDNSGDDLTQTFHKKSAEIVAFVLSNTEYCKCILEPSSKSIMEIKKNEMPEMDTLLIKEEMMKRLKIQRQSTLDSMITLSLKFDLYKVIKDSSITIIGREIRDTVTTRQSFDNWMDTLLKKCPEGLCYASKPIFNPDFTLVSFEIDYAGGCMPSPPNLLEFKNGKWTCEECGWF